MNLVHPSVLDPAFTEEALQMIANVMLDESDDAKIVAKEKAPEGSLFDSYIFGCVCFKSTLNRLSSCKEKLQKFEVVDSSFEFKFKIGDCICVFNTSTRKSSFSKVLKIDSENSQMDLLKDLDQPNHLRQQIKKGSFELNISLDFEQEDIIIFRGYNESSQQISEWKSSTKTPIIKMLDTELPPSYEIPPVDLNKIDQELPSDENLDGKNDLFDSNE